jgi:putative flavoprotein involved in K+ transport
LPVLRRRKSTFIDGIEADAREVIAHLDGHLAGRPPGADRERPALV